MTIVAIGILLLGLANIFRATSLSRQSDLQLELGVSLDPRLRLIIAVIWAFVLIVAAVALWLRRPETRIAIPVLLTIYAIYRMAIVVLFGESEYARGSLLATAILYGCAILFTTWALNHRKAREYFVVIKEVQEDNSSFSISSG